MPNSGLNETKQRRQAESDRLTIRDLTYADLPAVISIERRSFTSPWSPGMFVLEMSKDSTIGLVEEVDRRVAGYIVLSRYDRAWHLMNVAVDPDRGRSGIATALIADAIGRIGEETPVTLEVRPSNRSAITLYERLGFRPFGHRQGYYPDNGEDAMIMWRGDPGGGRSPRRSSRGPVSRMPMLAIETSCDDTCAAVLDGLEILSNVVSSQGVHDRYGGVVPGGRFPSAPRTDPTGDREGPRAGRHSTSTGSTRSR